MEVLVRLGRPTETVRVNCSIVKASESIIEMRGVAKYDKGSSERIWKEVGESPGVSVFL